MTPWSCIGGAQYSLLPAVHVWLATNFIIGKVGSFTHSLVTEREQRTTYEDDRSQVLPTPTTNTAVSLDVTSLGIVYIYGE